MFPSIRKVYIKNYKSIAQAGVSLEPLTIFVGPNGAGKSNFIDAMAFVQECLSESVELAFKNRGGIGAVRRRSTGHPTHIGIRVVLDLDENTSADYAFEIAAKRTERFSVAQERCVVRTFMGEEHSFEVRNGTFKKEIAGIRPVVSPDRLVLFAASATEEFRPVYDFLTSMRFYSIVPERLRELQEPDTGDFLKRDGRNAAAVLKRIRENDRGGETYDRICRLLSKIVQGVEGVDHRAMGQKETLQFRQSVGRGRPWTFDAINMSDGTLRVLGVFLAVYQPGRHFVVAIEEPEATIHPAAAEAVVEVLMDAAHEKQILLTTHSPDILEQKDLSDAEIRVVTKEQSRTLISPVSDSSREAIRKRLYTAGELLRSGELNPDLEEGRMGSQQLDLFGPAAGPKVKQQ